MNNEDILNEIKLHEDTIEWIIATDYGDNTVIQPHRDAIAQLKNKKY